MNGTTCSFDGCERITEGRTPLCRTHNQQRRRTGRLTPIARHSYSTAHEAIAENHYVSDNGCWQWTGSINHNGYPTVSCYSKPHRAHRLSYQAHVGEIPTGMDIDHMCRNRACVNPNHLQVATRKQNAENLSSVGRGRSGVRGVYWEPRTNKWCARVKHGDVRFWLGRFERLEDARAAAKAKRLQVYTNSLSDMAEDDRNQRIQRSSD